MKKSLFLLCSLFRSNIKWHKSLSISTYPSPKGKNPILIFQGIKATYKENITILTFRKIQDLVQVLQTRWQVMSVWRLLPETHWFNRHILLRNVRRTRQVILKDWLGLSLRFCRRKKEKKTQKYQDKRAASFLDQSWNNFILHVIVSVLWFRSGVRTQKESPDGPTRGAHWL